MPLNSAGKQGNKYLSCNIMRLRDDGSWELPWPMLNSTDVLLSAILCVMNQVFVSLEIPVLKF